MKHENEKLICTIFEAVCARTEIRGRLHSDLETLTDVALALIKIDDDVQNYYRRLMRRGFEDASHIVDEIMHDEAYLKDATYLLEELLDIDDEDFSLDALVDNWTHHALRNERITGDSINRIAVQNGARASRNILSMLKYGIERHKHRLARDAKRRIERNSAYYVLDMDDVHIGTVYAARSAAEGVGFYFAVNRDLKENSRRRNGRIVYTWEAAVPDWAREQADKIVRVDCFFDDDYRIREELKKIAAENDESITDEYDGSVLVKYA